VWRASVFVCGPRCVPEMLAIIRSVILENQTFREAGPSSHATVIPVIDRAMNCDLSPRGHRKGKA
jgi:hypothetical protein